MFNPQSDNFSTIFLTTISFVHPFTKECARAPYLIILFLFAIICMVYWHVT
jgi:hypothetical protein